MIQWLGITLLALLPLMDARADAPMAAVTPSVVKVDETHYQIGEIRLDQKTREIRFPAKVNLVEGLLEFLVVHENGKLHESLLATQITPSQLNIAFILLRYPPSRELYLLPNANGGYTNDFEVVPPEIKAAARILIEVEWQENGLTKSAPANDWVQHNVTTASLPAGPWVYGASEFEHEKYAPDITGDIVAIFTTNSAMINSPGIDNRDDDIWIPFPKRVPAIGTAVTVIITPFSK